VADPNAPKQYPQKNRDVSKVRKWAAVEKDPAMTGLSSDSPGDPSESDGSSSSDSRSFSQFGKKA
jgi:hypothetical protein